MSSAAKTGSGERMGRHICLQKGKSELWRLSLATGVWPRYIAVIATTNLVRLLGSSMVEWECRSHLEGREVCDFVTGLR